MRIVAILCVLVAVACGSKAPHKSRTFHVEMRGMQFMPPSLDVDVGDLVVWTNKDIVPHTVTSAGWFDSGLLQPNQQFSYGVGHPGELDYGCSVHPTMKAKLLAQ